MVSRRENESDTDAKQRDTAGSPTGEAYRGCGTLIGVSGCKRQFPTQRTRAWEAPSFTTERMSRLDVRTPYCDVEPTLSASQNPRTLQQNGVRRGAPDLCRALVKGRTPTDTPATAATDDLCCGGTNGVFGCDWFHASPPRTSAGGSKFVISRSGGLVPETTAKPRVTTPVVLHSGEPFQRGFRDFSKSSILHYNIKDSLRIVE